jgi:UDP-N-acetylglucosamine 2-epimerase (non-hydrolysing)
VKLPVVLPLHPRTAAAVEASGLTHLLNRFVVLEPQGSNNFLSLLKHAALVITDSGGLQEECTVLQRPFIAVRRSTERAESIGSFGTLVEPGELVSKTANTWLDSIEDVHAELSALPSPYGDGNASQRIVNEMLKRLG